MAATVCLLIPLSIAFAVLATVIAFKCRYNDWVVGCMLTLAVTSVSIAIACQIAVGALGERLDSVMAESVDRGHAEWLVDSKGKTKWQWKENH